VQLVDCSVATYALAIASAIRVSAGDLRVVGGSLMTVLAFCIVGNGAVRVDPAVGHNNPLFGPGVGTIAEMPSVVTIGGALGTPVAVAMRGPIGHAVVLLVGLPSPPVAVAGVFDPYWLQPGTEWTCAFTVLAAGTSVQRSYPIPSVPALRGVRLGWQGLSYESTAGLQASNPAITAHW
jgi:hypothetical protein